LTNVGNKNPSNKAGKKQCGWNYPHCFFFIFPPAQTRKRGSTYLMKMRRLTILLIPETGKRTRRIQLPQALLVVTATLILGLLVAVAVVAQTNRGLVRQITHLEPLQGIITQQQVELDKMVTQAVRMQGQLDQLHAVEANIREITAANAEMLAPQSKTILDERPEAALSGRGGGRAVSETVPEDVPLILSSFMPKEVTQALFMHRVQLQDALGSAVKLEFNVTPAQEIIARLASQIQASEMLHRRLSEHERTAESHLELLAHRPFGLPVSGGRLTDRFGWRHSPFGWGQQHHSGLDIAAPFWTPVVATAPGKVDNAGWKSGGFGYTVSITHAYGYQTVYAHLVDWNVTAGEQVDRGQLIGWVGSTGASTGPHLHYEIHVDGVPVDPAKYLD